MKKYLGLICILYSSIFGYVVIFNKLKNFLAPSMQIYIKLSIIPLLVIGISMLTNNSHYKFKISDLILLLPLILLIFAGDGRLTSSFASNRTTNFNSENRVKSKEIDLSNEETNLNEHKDNDEIKREEEKEEIVNNYDFSNPYFDIVDESYVDLANYITGAPNAVKYDGKTIKVRGFALKDIEFMDDDYFAVGKYEISCCAADAGFIGFVAKYDKSKITNDTWYEIEGILEKGKDKENIDIMYIKVINIKEIDSKNEEQYVYPCYAYGDGTCKSIFKYNLEY